MSYISSSIRVGAGHVSINIIERRELNISFTLKNNFIVSEPLFPNLLISFMVRIHLHHPLMILLLILIMFLRVIFLLLFIKVNALAHFNLYFALHVLYICLFHVMSIFFSLDS